MMLSSREVNTFRDSSLADHVLIMQNLSVIADNIVFINKVRYISFKKYHYMEKK